MDICTAWDALSPGKLSIADEWLVSEVRLERAVIVVVLGKKNNWRCCIL